MISNQAGLASLEVAVMQCTSIGLSMVSRHGQTAGTVLIDHTGTKIRELLSSSCFSQGPSCSSAVLLSLHVHTCRASQVRGTAAAE